MATVSGQHFEGHRFSRKSTASSSYDHGYNGYGAQNGGARGNVGRVFQHSIDNADVKIEGTGGQNYILQGSVNNSKILIQGTGGDNYIFQGSVTNSVIRVEGSRANNIIFQASLTGSDVRIYGTGGDRSATGISCKDSRTACTYPPRTWPDT
ncbi:hypothetical protein KFL_001330260 [Klebsormidium nitens]|uniref:Uncharacterized protein n=1 Tax=Klebsormidium nitens TaxID=105231 RepID=A0A0U9HJT4_KLENI|nr:hypothetical protein KFL_001330260 [Klebsormidium nitens]|eukprot:GAQ83043.1 hypothetical protein KFL_001330260 [Klebsormidium nitens]